MSDPITKVSTSRLIKHLNLRADVGKEIVRRLQESEEVQAELDVAETRISDLENGVEDIIDDLRRML